MISFVSSNADILLITQHLLRIMIHHLLRGYFYHQEKCLSRYYGCVCSFSSAETQRVQEELVTDIDEIWNELWSYAKKCILYASKRNTI